MLEVLGIQDADDLVPMEKDIKALDPVSENMNMLTGKPVKAYLYQDQEAHIQSHMSAMQDPKIMQMLQGAPNAQAIQATFMSHITDHVSMSYRDEMEKQLGIDLPPPGEELPEDVEVNLSRLISRAAAQVLQKDQAEIEMQKQMQQQQDPIIQMQQKELQIKEQDVAQKGQIAQAKIQADLQKAEMQNEADRERMAVQAEMEEGRLEAESERAEMQTLVGVATDAERIALERQRLEIETKIEGAKIGADAVENSRADKAAKLKIMADLHKAGAKIGADAVEKKRKAEIEWDRIQMERERNKRE
jgi:hypothetical protein